MAELEKYNTETTIYFPLITRGSTDFDPNLDSTSYFFVEGDCKISKAGSGFANTSFLPEHVGYGIYELKLSATETETTKIVIIIISQSDPKLWEDQAILIKTFGNPLAALEIDLDTDNSSNIEAIKDQTDKFDFDTSDNINNIINANIVTVLDALPLTIDDVVPEATVNAIKAQTDQLDFDTSGLLQVDLSSIDFSTIDVDLTDLEASVAIIDTNVNSIKETTDKFDFDTSDNINNIINANVVTVLGEDPITTDDLVAKSEVDSIKAQTDQLDFDTAGLLQVDCAVGDLSDLEANVAAILVDTSRLTSKNIL